MELKDFVILGLAGLALWLFFKPESAPGITVQEPAYSQPAVVYATPAPATIPLVEATATAPHYVEAVPVPTQPRIDFEATTDAFMLTLETAVSEPTVVPPTAQPTDTPAPILSGYGLPVSGPYSLQEVGICQMLINDGKLPTMTSPQRELCEMYTGSE